MSLIKCPECQQQISDTIKKCPHCGYKFKKNKKLIIGVLIILLIVATIITIICALVINHNQETAKQKEKEYNELLTATVSETYINGLAAELCCYDIGKVWYNSIFEVDDYKYNKYTKKTTSYGGGYSYSTFNKFSTSIENYKSENKETLDKIKDYKTKISEKINTLKNSPNQKYTDIYNEMVTFYGIYSKLIDSATSPSGTYSDYITSYTNYSKDFEESYNRIIVLKPEIRDYTLNNNETTE